jgi:hypothetical protein
MPKRRDGATILDRKNNHVICPGKHPLTKIAGASSELRQSPLVARTSLLSAGRKKRCMKRIFYGLLAAGFLAAGPAFAGEPVLSDGKGRAITVDTAAKLQKEWNAYVKAHGIKRNGYIYTPYSSKFRRGGIHCDDTGTNISPACDVDDTTIFGGS